MEKRQQSQADTARPSTLPDGYVEKNDGTIAPNDRVWNPAEGTFEPAGKGASIGTPVAETHAVVTPAHWVTYDETTGTVWGVGESPEESLQAAKFEAYGDDHGGIGYEFACWCEELNTEVCSEALYVQASDQGRLSLSDDRIQKHVLST
jgi:hypothetical protein